MDQRRAKKQSLDIMPEDLRMVIVSKVGANSALDYFNAIIASKSLCFRFDNRFIARDLNLEPFVKKPAQAKRYRSLMDSCLKANNVHAHFVTGMLQYFDSPNQFLGMHHLRIASKAGHLQGRYVYGVLLMAIGQTEKGVRIINKLTKEKGIETVKNCIQDFTLSLYRLDRNMKDIYVTSLTTMKPDHQCQPPDNNTACSKCYHFFLMTEFFETMIGLN
ncbi:F-box protein At2g35280-like [Brassica rapa]|nr:F-box protein At2g35280-like [Brassica rapa]